MSSEHRKRLIIASVIIVAILIITPTTYYELTKQTSPKLTVIEGDQNYTWSGYFTNTSTMYLIATMKNITASTIIEDPGYSDSYLNMTFSSVEASHHFAANSTWVDAYLAITGSLNSHLQPTSLSIMQNTTFNASTYHSVSAGIIPNFHNNNINMSYDHGNINAPGFYNNSFGQFSFVENLLNVSSKNNGIYHFYFYSEIEFEIVGIWPGEVPVLNFNAGMNGLSSPVHAQIKIRLNDAE